MYPNTTNQGWLSKLDNGILFQEVENWDKIPRLTSKLINYGYYLLGYKDGKGISYSPKFVEYFRDELPENNGNIVKIDIYEVFKIIEEKYSADIDTSKYSQNYCEVIHGLFCILVDSLISNTFISTMDNYHLLNSNDIGDIENLESLYREEALFSLGVDLYEEIDLSEGITPDELRNIKKAMKDINLVIDITDSMYIKLSKFIDISHMEYLIALEYNLTGKDRYFNLFIRSI
jgi:hypothetical protein